MVNDNRKLLAIVDRCLTLTPIYALIEKPYVDREVVPGSERKVRFLLFWSSVEYEYRDVEYCPKDQEKLEVITWTGQLKRKDGDYKFYYAKCSKCEYEIGKCERVVYCD